MSVQKALVSIAEYEKEAARLLSSRAWDFYRSGAGDELTLELNTKCFERLRIRPRVMVDVSKRQMTTEVLGLKLALPVGTSPTALHRMAHPDGEIGTAKAAEKLGAGFILSTFSSTSIEDVAQATPGLGKWFQCFIFKDRKWTASLIQRAEQAGFKGVVLTVNAPVFGIRRNDLRSPFQLPEGIKFANFGTDFHKDQMTVDPSVTWKDLEWVKSLTSLPVIVKGILTAEDALVGVQSGADGIIVSNHGARQLDSAPATIEVLSEVVDAVGQKTTVMMDGGVRQGTDVFKALALGAKAVFVGRPVLWGLAVEGQKGVESVLEILRRELDIIMALTGSPTLHDIKREMVSHESRLFT